MDVCSFKNLSLSLCDLKMNHSPSLYKKRYIRLPYCPEARRGHDHSPLFRPLVDSNKWFPKFITDSKVYWEYHWAKNWESRWESHFTSQGIHFFISLRGVIGMNIFKVLFKLSQLIIQVPASWNRHINHLVPEGKARDKSPPWDQASNSWLLSWWSNILSSSPIGNIFIATRFTITRTRKQPKYPSTEEWIKMMWYTYTIEYYSAIKKNDIMPFVAIWTDLEIVIWSK